MRGDACRNSPCLKGPSCAAIDLCQGPRYVGIYSLVFRIDKLSPPLVIVLSVNSRALSWVIRITAYQSQFRGVKLPGFRGRSLRALPSMITAPKVASSLQCDLQPD
jgi:hypothetical protein